MLTCRSGGDVITRHNQLRDCIADFCHKTCLSPQIEKESGILPKDQSRPADIQVPNWSLSCPAAFDIKVINPLNLIKAGIHGSTFVEQQVDCAMNAIIFSVKH